MAKHTTEPWAMALDEEKSNKYQAGKKTRRYDIRGDGLLIGTVWAEHEFIFHKSKTPTQSEQDANITRIIACVNACGGLNPVAMPASVSIVRSIYSILKRYFDGNVNGWDDQEILHSLKDYLEDMKAAIALMEKGGN